MLSVPEIGLIAFLGVVVFGAGKLKNIGKDLGEGIKEFKKASVEEEKAGDEPAKEAQEKTDAEKTDAKKD